MQDCWHSPVQIKHKRDHGLEQTAYWSRDFASWTKKVRKLALWLRKRFLTALWDGEPFWHSSPAFVLAHEVTWISTWVSPDHMGFSVFSDALPLLFHKSLAPQKPNQFKQGSRWNAFRGHCKVPAKIPVAKRYVKQHATALFRATFFPLKRPFQSQSVKERSVILSNIPFISFDRVAGSSVGQKNPYYCGLLCDRK